jgi:hypothetical protein
LKIIIKKIDIYIYIERERGDLPKLEKGELRKDGREEERELAPRPMPRVFCLLFLLFEEFELFKPLFDFRLELAEEDREESKLIFFPFLLFFFRCDRYIERIRMECGRSFLTPCCSCVLNFKRNGKSEVLILYAGDTGRLAHGLVVFLIIWVLKSGQARAV